MSASNLNLVNSILAMDPDNIGADDDGHEEEWNSMFTLRASMLPISYFPASLAEKILFIGKAVRVLQSKKTVAEDRIPLADLEAFSEAIMKLQKMPEFNVLLFTRIIEKIRECITNRLWHLVVVKADLQIHLRAIKDFFLLGRGEFYQTFLQEAREQLMLPPTNTAEYDLNVGPLQQTKIKLGLEEDQDLQKFKFRLRSFNFAYKHFSTRQGLVYNGSVQIDTANQFRIEGTKHSSKAGCLWHSLKQNIDNGFRSTFAFRLKNPLIHDAKGALNQSIVSVPGSPNKLRHSVLGMETPARASILNDGSEVG